jgi:hypothetical protein
MRLGRSAGMPAGRQPALTLLPLEDRRAEQLASQLRPIAEAAQIEFVLVSPYFVPGDRGVTWFRELRQRG